MDFHLIAAKRAVSDSLSRARAWILVQQQEAIDGLKEQVSLCGKEKFKLSQKMAADAKDCQEVLDANRDLQIKLGKQQSWATVGKVGVILVGLVTVGVVVGQFVP